MKEEKNMEGWNNYLFKLSLLPKVSEAEIIQYQKSKTKSLGG